VFSTVCNQFRPGRHALSAPKLSHVMRRSRVRRREPRRSRKSAAPRSMPVWMPRVVTANGAVHAEKIDVALDYMRRLQRSRKDDARNPDEKFLLHGQERTRRSRCRMFAEMIELTPTT
jgi:hypothetical protein